MAIRYFLNSAKRLSLGYSFHIFLVHLVDDSATDVNIDTALIKIVIDVIVVFLALKRSKHYCVAQQRKI